MEALTATCKIKGCRAPIYRANLCEPMYQQFLESGELPGPIKRRRARERPTVRSPRQKITAERQVLRAADRLYAAALALPDVVRSHDLRLALGRYHAARAAAEEE